MPPRPTTTPTRTTTTTGRRAGAAVLRRAAAAARRRVARGDARRSSSSFFRQPLPLPAAPAPGHRAAATARRSCRTTSRFCADCAGAQRAGRSGCCRRCCAARRPTATPRAWRAPAPSCPAGASAQSSCDARAGSGCAASPDACGDATARRAARRRRSAELDVRRSTAKRWQLPRRLRRPAARRAACAGATTTLRAARPASAPGCTTWSLCAAAPPGVAPAHALAAARRRRCVSQPCPTPRAQLAELLRPVPPRACASRCTSSPSSALGATSREGGDSTPRATAWTPTRSGPGPKARDPAYRLALRGAPPTRSTATSPRWRDAVFGPLLQHAVERMDAACR
ncbi:MAG: hypothetical protein MZW92_28675 [Comamonadaceae bacterium]|nr:hypothetical protein [Comamonadaceae bacterium]